MNNKNKSARRVAPQPTLAANDKKETCPNCGEPATITGACSIPCGE